MAERRLVLDRGEEAVLRHLEVERDQIASLERRLSAARNRRKLLCEKAVRAGIPLRTLEPYAGLTNVRISQITSQRSS